MTKQEIENIQLAEQLGNIIAKAQVTQGYATFSPADQDVAVAAWLELFKRYNIPPSAINRLYLLAKETRIAIYQSSGRFVEFSADFVVSQWDSLKKQLDAENKTSRLSTKIIHGCRKCFGTNRVHAFWNDPGKRKSITSEICTHLDDDGNPTFSEID